MVQDFIIIGILSIPIGFSITTFIKGKFPTIGGGGYRNRVIFGDGSADPVLLVGLRARIVGLFFGGIFALIVFAVYIQNEIMSGQYFKSVLSILIGSVIGIVWHTYILGQTSDMN